MFRQGRSGSIRLPGCSTIKTQILYIGYHFHTALPPASEDIKKLGAYKYSISWYTFYVTYEKKLRGNSYMNFMSLSIITN